MIRLTALLMAASLALTACTTTGPQLGPDGKPLPKLYRISANDTQKIQTRVVEAVNSLRGVRGTPPVALNTALNEAALIHSRDMALQNRPWHWGSDGSSPLDRVARAGFRGEFLGENISETYETETETLSAWMNLADTRDVILNPEATQMGFSWYQEPSGKIWWTMVTGK
ncbi:serine protease [Rhodobacter sp. TJ_12]|uniref:CAP domain-containing protein n=1 Tax=Rhodobacter sp. TJ_12 TaxID=2029399 RepID=UPI001CBEADE9|nr:CAP domain-containing protein [Rhodobacter sp. TJ_12]MBZ4020897.1 serine protease [Rhodobacter sp. TJ_12]